MAIETLALRTRQITNEASGINTFEFVDPQGRELPQFAAGSHIDVHIPNGFVRQYSLCNDPRERHRYVIGVLNDPQSSGGSKAMHDKVRAGDPITVSKPRNNFPIVADAQRHLLLAGGIGVTPMMSIIEQLDADGRDFELHYCTRSAEQTAFQDRLERYVRNKSVINHYDGGDPANGLDINALLRDHRPGTHLYYCGPAGFMQAIKHSAAHWPEDAVHFEYFRPPQESIITTVAMNDDFFQIRLISSGASYYVTAGESIVDVLRDNGHDVDTSCEAGTCGTCKTRYLEGAPIHNDYVLTRSEQKQWVMICCARSTTSTLVLDL